MSLDSTTLMIKSLTKHQVNKVGGTVPASKVCGTTPGMISHYTNVNVPHTINALSLIRLSNVTQDECLIQYILEQSQFEHATPTPVDAKGIFKAMARINKEALEFSNVTLAALEDEKVTEFELGEMTKELLGYRDEIDKLIRAISSKRGGETTETTESTT